MVFTVELQETMRFGLWILGAAAVMLALSAVFFLLYRRLRHRLAVIDSGKGAEGDMSLAALNEAKERYLKELDNIEKAVDEGRMTHRAAFQRMSLLLRSFACEVKNVPAQYLTLRELKFAKIPSVFGMVLEYYEPEFSSGSEADLKASLNKTRKVIKQWI